MNKSQLIRHFSTGVVLSIIAKNFVYADYFCYAFSLWDK